MARLKACHDRPWRPLAVTTAAAHGLTLLTGDPEILDLAEPRCGVEDLRR
ncbi:MAG TPA: hypothetical protein VGO80_02625 [Solirubrobacteraceae bacterium]|nr:hypothetical protein [Solirubrobacteraceae bacterium]